MTNSILIVDDEPDFIDSLECHLQQEGYRTQAALTGAVALDLLVFPSTFDLVILDLMLPDLSGMEVCRQLRLHVHTRMIPVLILTALHAERDRVIGFEMGADDYVVKPFSIRELLLRIRALLRRRPPEPYHTGPLEFGILRVDTHTYEVQVDGQSIKLTALEFRLLVTFMNRRGVVQTRDMLLSDVWNIHVRLTTRTVDTHIKRLREKLGAAGQYIETLRGLGYRFKATQPPDPPSPQEGSVEGEPHKA